MNNVIYRSQIKNIGKRLRAALEHDKLIESDLNYLSNWRAHHSTSLEYYSNTIKLEIRKLNIPEAQWTITQRLKRISSIILKLKRYENMQLSMMEDIAGIRVVLPQIKNVLNLVDNLKKRKSKNPILKINNYISHPKEDGYRSIHIVYKVKKTPDIFIEIQIRSHLQHIWATGVEIFGTLEKTSFKTGDGNKKWREFFNLLSSCFSLKEGGSVLKEHEIYSNEQLNKLLIKNIKELNIIEQLNAYTSAYSSNWRKERPKGRSGKYALLILNTATEETKVLLYAENDLNKALEEYSSIEKVNHRCNEINVVLVNLDNMDKLEKAYPNYFMDTKDLSNYLSKIVLGEF